MKKSFLFKYHLFLISLSICIGFYLLGFDYINPQNTEWLYAGDLSTYQLGWQFFRIDEWHFPIGMNPNYGIYLNNSIVFSDSIPFLAIFFKIFRNFIPTEFQYFSIWILICIYLQLFFSFKIIHKKTNDLIYSLIGSLFFCFATIFIHRSGIHLSLLGQWIILSYFYIELLDKNKKFYYKSLITLFSTSIHFYFTIILFLFLLIENIYEFFCQKKIFRKIIFELLGLLFCILFLMYILGYFSLNLDDGLGWGYGYYNFNLNSFFNPFGKTNLSNIEWSSFLSIKQFQNGEIEGFSYLGIGGFCLLIIFIFNFFFKKDKIIYTNNKTLVICLTFLILSISNNINIGDTNIIYIPLNNIFYVIMSSIRASGRLIWPVYYLIFIIGIVFIFNNFNKRVSLFIIVSLFCVQILDLSQGLSNYKFGKQYTSTKNHPNLKSEIWSNLPKKFDQIRLLEPKNQSKIYSLLSKKLFKEKFLKTDIIYLARVNRQEIVNQKYALINLYNKKDLEVFNKTVFISDNINTVKYLYYIYKDKLNYYFRDNLWIISKKNIYENELDDSLYLKEIYNHNFDNKNYIFFDVDNSIPRIGWKKKLNVDGLVMDGYESGLVMIINGNLCNENSILRLKVDKFYLKKSHPINLILLINNKETKNIIINENENDLSIKFNCFNDRINNIFFQVDKPKSLFDEKVGLNRNKRSIILKSLSILN